MIQKSKGNLILKTFGVYLKIKTWDLEFIEKNKWNPTLVLRRSWAAKITNTSLSCFFDYNYLSPIFAENVTGGGVHYYRVFKLEEIGYYIAMEMGRRRCLKFDGKKAKRISCADVAFHFDFQNHIIGREEFDDYEQRTRLHKF